MTSLYENTEIRETAERLVRNDVVLCVSHTLHLASQNPEAGADILDVDSDDLHTLFSRDVVTYKTTDGRTFDDESDAEEHASDLTAVETHLDPNTGRVVLYRTSDGETFPKEDRFANASDLDDAELHASDLDDVTEESETFEALEHWVVSHYLAERLEAYGCIVTQTSLGWIWGRCASGQHISLDSVILEIARDVVDFCKAA